MNLHNLKNPIVLNECLEALGMILEYNLKDHPMHQHTIRVGEGCVLIADRLGLEKKTIQRIYFAGLLHDIGKISVPLHILNKKDSLTNDEFEIVKKHSAEGSKIIASLPGLDKIALWIRWHHEKWDGSGYPEGLFGNEIPIEVQILSAVDCWDSLLTPRMDRKAYSVNDAAEIMNGYRGTSFNSEVVDLIEDLQKKKELIPGKSSGAFLDLKEKYLREPIVENEYMESYGIMGLYPVLRLFAKVIDAKHHYTQGHSTRVSILSKYIADELGFSVDDLIKIEIAGLLHDAGKVSIPNEVLDKRNPPTKEEWVIIKEHPVLSSEILKRISVFDELSDIVFAHHIWADGRGYPENRSDKPVHVLSGIIAVADAYDAITTERAYGEIGSPADAYKIIKDGLGSQFDSAAGNVLINTPSKYIKALFDSYDR